jgi:hypothetical protein
VLWAHRVLLTQKKSRKETITTETETIIAVMADEEVAVEGLVEAVDAITTGETREEADLTGTAEPQQPLIASQIIGMVAVTMVPSEIDSPGNTMMILDGGHPLAEEETVVDKEMAAEEEREVEADGSPEIAVTEMRWNTNQKKILCRRRDGAVEELVVEVEELVALEETVARTNACEWMAAKKIPMLHIMTKAMIMKDTMTAMAIILLISIEAASADVVEDEADSLVEGEVDSADAVEVLKKVAKVQLARMEPLKVETETFLPKPQSFTLHPWFRPITATVGASGAVVEAEALCAVDAGEASQAALQLFKRLRRNLGFVPRRAETMVEEELKIPALAQKVRPSLLLTTCLCIHSCIRP